MDKYIELTIEYFTTFKTQDYDKMTTFLKDHTQYLNWTRTYVGMDDIINANKHIITNAETNFEVIIKTIGKHDKEYSPTNVTFAEITFKQDKRYNHKIFTIEWDNDYKMNRIIGYTRI